MTADEMLQAINRSREKEAAEDALRSAAMTYGEAAERAMAARDQKAAKLLGAMASALAGAADALYALREAEGEIADIRNEHGDTLRLALLTHDGSAPAAPTGPRDVAVYYLKRECSVDPKELGISELRSKLWFDAGTGFYTVYRYEDGTPVPERHGIFPAHGRLRKTAWQGLPVKRVMHVLNEQNMLREERSPSMISDRTMKLIYEDSGLEDIRFFTMRNRPEKD